MTTTATEPIERDMENLLQIGSVEGKPGVNRIAYSPQEDEAHRYIRARMEEVGLETKVDGAGNLCGLPKNEEPKIVIGSHLDTVYGGGNYDGALGVVMGIEVARKLSNQNRGLAVVAFRAEESSRFGISCVGSKLATGFLTVEQAQGIRDKNGISIYESIQASGFDPATPTPWKKAKVALYIEPHIEQGEVLIRTNVPIGIVTGIRAPARYDIAIKGVEAHSGATPMNARKDAMVAFSEMTLAVERLARSYGDDAVATVPTIQPSQYQSINKVPGQVSFGLDIRGSTPEALKELDEKILHELNQIAENRGVNIELQLKERGTPARLRKEDYMLVMYAAKKLGIPAIEMPSGAGHDAQYIALYGIPTAMLFVRNFNGSHNPAESVHPADIEAGVNVLTRTVLEASIP